MNKKITPLHFQDESADRREAFRLQPEALAAALQAPDAQFLLVRGGRVRVAADGPVRLVWSGPGEAAPFQAQGMEPVFLGLFDGAPHFGLVVDEAPQTAANRPREQTPEGDFVGLLQIAATLSPAESQFAAQALHLANWTNRTRHCGRCGGPMRMRDAGHKRICESCGWQEFPRTDPVVITIVISGERCVLARQPRMPPGFYAAVAGFVAPGETLEAAVRREVHEEVGLRVGAVRYIGSQPWPFPSSLMIGFLARAEGEDIVVDHNELEDARWFERRDVAALCLQKETAEGALGVPRRGSMARRLVEGWALEGWSI